MPHLPKIVRQRLQGPTNASNLHPDADVLTAFAEKSLPDSERAHVTDHLARCGDCREIVALALPATKETTVVGRSAGTAWRTGWFLRWGVVAAGIALAASVGIVQLRERHLMHVADSALSRQEVAATTPTPAGHLASDGVEDGRVKRDRVPGRNMEQETRAASKTDTDQEKFAPGIASRVAPQPSRGESAKASRLYPGTAAGAAGSSTGREAKFAMAAPPRDLLRTPRTRPQWLKSSYRLDPHGQAPLLRPYRLPPQPQPCKPNRRRLTINHNQNSLSIRPKSRKLNLPCRTEIFPLRPPRLRRRKRARRCPLTRKSQRFTAHPHPAGPSLPSASCNVLSTEERRGGM